MLLLTRQSRPGSVSLLNGAVAVHAPGLYSSIRQKREWHEVLGVPEAESVGAAGNVAGDRSSWALRWVERRRALVPRLHELKLMTTLLRPAPSTQSDHSAHLSTSFRQIAILGRERVDEPRRAAKGEGGSSSPPIVNMSEDQWFLQPLRIPNQTMRANHSSTLMFTYRGGRKPVRSREVSTSFCQKGSLGVSGKGVTSFNSWAPRWGKRRRLAVPRLHELKLMTTLLGPVPGTHLSTSFRPNATPGTRERHLPSAVGAPSRPRFGNGSRGRSLQVPKERARHLASAAPWNGSFKLQFPQLTAVSQSLWLASIVFSQANLGWRDTSAPRRKWHGDHNFSTWRRQPPARGNEFAC